MTIPPSEPPADESGPTGPTNETKTEDAPARGPRVLTSLMGPGDLKTPEQRSGYGDQLTDEIVALVQAERARLGLPPLT
jgi:hypothetical protein